VSAHVGSVEPSGRLRRLPLAQLGWWVAGIVCAFGAAFALGWVLAPTRTERPQAVRIPSASIGHVKPLRRVQPLPALARAKPKPRPKPKPRVRVAAAPPPAPAPVRRPAPPPPPPPPPPVVIIGKG
jgi:hypothetical protein